MELPVFSDYVKNVEKEDADDLRYFIANAIQPVDVDRDFCIDQIIQIRENKAAHPFLRWRSRQALKVLQLFRVMNRNKITSAIFDYGKQKGVRLVNFTPSFFDKPSTLTTVDHTICECAGHIVFPQNPQKLKAILVVLQANPATEKKFTEFVHLATSTLEAVMQDSLENIIEALGAEEPRKLQAAKPFNTANNVRVLQR